MNVLVVDDSPLNRLPISSYLQQMGHQVMVAANVLKPFIYGRPIILPLF